MKPIFLIGRTCHLLGERCRGHFRRSVFRSGCWQFLKHTRGTDSAKVVHFDEFSNMGRVFFDDSRHFGIVVSDGSGGLEHELELAFWGVGVVVKYFSQGSLLAFFIIVLIASLHLNGSSCRLRSTLSRSFCTVPI